MLNTLHGLHEQEIENQCIIINTALLEGLKQLRSEIPEYLQHFSRTCRFCMGADMLGLSLENLMRMWGLVE